MYKFKKERDRSHEESNDCFNCGKPGHFSKECPKPKSKYNSKKEEDITCFLCKKEGHF